jgi:hypothetical protein
MIKRILLTDILFPNKYAKWRLVEIHHFIGDYDTDIMVIKRTNMFSGVTYDFDYDLLNEKFGLSNYDILIFNPSFNYINKYNSNFDGTKYNNLLPCDYLLQKTKFRDIPFNINNYNFVYHIFLMNYIMFNNYFLYEQKKQFIHLYPGGGFQNNNCINQIHPETNIIPSQQFISKLNRKTSFLNIYGGPFFYKDEICRKKVFNEKLCICFTSLGNIFEKGADVYISLVNKFYEKYSFNNDYTFISIGNCNSSEYITHYNCMDQLSLSKFYNENVDILISLDSGIALNGFPLGIESIIEGCILLTTDVHNQNILNKFNFDDFFIIDRNNLDDIISKILFLKNIQYRIDKQLILQSKIYNLFNYNNTNKIINTYIYTMDIYNSLVKDSGGACPPHKFMYIYNNFIYGKNITNIVEIGVYNGCFLLPITFMNNNTLSYGIDPYESFIQNDIENISLYNTAASISKNSDFLNNVYNRLINNIEKFNLNVKIIRDKAENVSNLFENNSIDILHVDGNHDYDSVLKDLTLYNEKISVNGIIIMDDINWKSVKSALDNFLNSTNNFKLIHNQEEWCIIQKC